MKTYTKIIDGKRVRKTRNQIVIIKDGRQYINPKEEMLLADGWEEYIEPTEDELTTAKKRLIRTITAYDSSSEVNVFYMNGIPMWLDKATRAGLMLRFQAEQSMGMSETTLWYDGVMYTLPIESAFGMLMSLEVYASKCYDNTQRHLANVNGLESIEQIEAYDYREGYPAKLEF